MNATEILAVLIVILLAPHLSSREARWSAAVLGVVMLIPIAIGMVVAWMTA